MEIEVICSQNSAHKTVKEALQAAMEDKLIGNVNLTDKELEDLQKQLDHNMENHGEGIRFGVNDDGEVAETGLFEEGKPDFNGNVVVPLSGDTYNLVLNGNDINLYVEFSDMNFLGLKDTCNARDSASQITVEKIAGYYRLTTADGRILSATKKREVSLETETDLTDLDRFMWKTIVHVSGSVSFMNKKYRGRVLSVDRAASTWALGAFDRKSNNERFFLRQSSCLDELRDFEGEATAGNGDRRVNLK